MKKTFTPLYVFATIGCLAIASIIYGFTTDDKDNKKKTEKRIEVVIENGEKKVTVTTIENGKKTIETFTGEKAEEYLSKEGMGNGQMQMSFDFNIDTLLGKNSFDFKMNGFGEEFAKELEEMMKELKASGQSLQLDLSEMFKSLDSSMKDLHSQLYMFNFNGDMSNLDSLLQGNFDINIDVDDTDKQGRKKKIIVAHSVVIEDLDKKGSKKGDVAISDFSFYPNPSAGNFTLKYKSESLDLITLVITDLNGKKVYEERISATGTVLRNIELKENAGVYILTLSQGKKTTSKKLIIE